MAAFNSATLSRDKATEFAGRGQNRVLFEIRLPAGSSGAYLNAADASEMPSERELLLPPGTEYRIVGRGEDAEVYGIKYPVVILERMK